jgi:2-polyprenyl-3-methyl-5-hydroxy-6-metoxy-1,4-benzoquinol methylase
VEREVIENHKRYVDRKALYQRFGYDLEKERAFIIEKARPISGRILEAGTGKGHFTLALAREGWGFTTFDMSETEQVFAKLNLKYYRLDRQVDFAIANGESLGYEDGCFDVIFSVNMIHHLSSAYKVFAELGRVLAPDGKMVLSDFNPMGFAIVEKIHSLEGKRHEVSATTLEDIERYLIDRKFIPERHQSAYQDTLIAYRGA